MAPLSVKRQPRQGGAVKKPRKRQKVEVQESYDLEESHKEGLGLARSVCVDEFSWQEVALPDRLEDAEGFFGLEEIDGVDVLRPQGKGDVRYRLVSTQAKKRPLSLPNGTPLAQYEASTGVSSNGYDSDEWSGFGDDSSGVERATTNSSMHAFNGRETRSRAMDKTYAESTTRLTHENDDTQIDVPFAALEDQHEVEEFDVSAWKSLDLSFETQSSLSKLKFSTPTPIQSACIPKILAGHDVVGKASTGSGKTLAFGIPILEEYLALRRKGPNQRKLSSTKSQGNYPLALILSPTRELAHQLSKHLCDLNGIALDDGPKVATLTGGLSIHKQQRLLADVDIVIGTPGRLWELLSAGRGLIGRIKQVRYLVLDEADRLLSEGHFKELEEILNVLGRTDDDDDETDHSQEQGRQANPRSIRQTLVFSATFHKGLQQKLAGKGKYIGGELLDNRQSMEYLLRKLNWREAKPKFIDVNPNSQMAEGLREGLVECSAMEKDLYLYSLLLYHAKLRTLIFTNSISAVRRLTPFLQNLNLPALALHSSMPQKARLRSVERFSSSPSQSSSSSILVATDVAARGLDIKGIELVLHYHVPRTADMYVHRSGRTARAEKTGKSILLCSPEEVAGVNRLVAKVHSSAALEGRTHETKVSSSLRAFEIDRKLVSRLQPRVTLAKKITDTTLAKEKKVSKDEWLRSAAEELGVDYDSDEFAIAAETGRNGRGGGRKKREKEARSLSKAEVGDLGAELKELLGKRINVGVSDRYLTGGRVDVNALLQGQGNAEFLGQVDTLDF